MGRIALVLALTHTGYALDLSIPDSLTNTASLPLHEPSAAGLADTHAYHLHNQKHVGANLCLTVLEMQ